MDGGEVGAEVLAHAFQDAAAAEGDGLALDHRRQGYAKGGAAEKGRVFAITIAAFAGFFDVVKDGFEIGCGRFALGNVCPSYQIVDVAFF